MDIVLSDHARYQMRERNISDNLVREAILRPDHTVPQGARTRFLQFVTRAEKRMLAVVVAEVRDTTCTVVTVFITSKVTKYIP